MIKKFTSGNPIDTQAVVEKFNDFAYCGISARRQV